MAAKLYTDMTRVTLVLLHLNGILESAFQKNLTPEELAEAESEVRELSGMEDPHPAGKTTLVPFVETFFSRMKEWLDGKKDGEALLYFINVLNGNQVHAASVKFEMQNGEGKHTPAWYHQILEIGKALKDPTGAIPEKTQERVAGLLRNIPVDTTLGFIAHAFLRERFLPSPDPALLEKYWGYLSRERPLSYQLNVRGTYVWLEC